MKHIFNIFYTKNIHNIVNKKETPCDATCNKSVELPNHKEYI